MRDTQASNRITARQIWKRQIRQFCDVWLCASNRAPKTIQGYRADLMQFARQLSPDLSAKRLRRLEIEQWVARLQKLGYAGNSVRRKLASLRAFFTYLAASNVIDESPMKDVRLRLGSMRKLTRTVPRRDVRAMLRTVGRKANARALARLSNDRQLLRLRNALALRLLCATGIRVGELVALQIQDVQEQEMKMVIRGKGNRERLAFIVDCGTASLLRRYLRLARRGSVLGGPLLKNSAGGPLTTEGVRRLLRMVAAQSGTSHPVTPHMLRHTAATSLLENGADVRIVQEFLGHDSIRSTERYTHVSQWHLLRVLRTANPLKRVA